MHSDSISLIVSTEDLRPDILGTRSVVEEFYKDLVNNHPNLLYRFESAVPEEDGWYRTIFKFIRKASQFDVSVKFDRVVCLIRKNSDGSWDYEEV